MSNMLTEEVAEIIHNAEDVLHDVLEGLSEEEILAHSKHRRAERFLLLGRNIAVAVAMLFFTVSLFSVPCSHYLKATAYFLGAIAYFQEIVLLTDFFSKQVPHQEMFMAYCFGPMYVLLGLSYLFGH